MGIHSERDRMTGTPRREPPWSAQGRLCGLLLGAVLLVSLAGCGAETTGAGAPPVEFATLDPLEEAAVAESLYGLFERVRDHRRAELDAQLTEAGIGTAINGPSVARFEGIVGNYLSRYYADTALEMSFQWETFPALSRPTVADLFLTLGETELDFLTALTEHWLRAYGDGTMTLSIERLHAATDQSVSDALISLGFYL